MTTRTTIEFQRVVGAEIAGRAAVQETVNADVLIDGESVTIDLPTGGRWACDQADLFRLIRPEAWASTASSRTTIEFERVTGTEGGTGVAVAETVNADVLVDGESVQVDLPAPGRWACGLEELRAILDASN